MKMNTNVIIAGLVCITIIELYALYRGHNGLLLTIVVGTIAAAIGVTIPTPKQLLK